MIAVFIKVVSFLAALYVLPVRCIPLTAKAALAVSISVLLFPVLAHESENIGFLSLFQSGFVDRFIVLGLPGFVFCVAQGVLLAVVVSSSAFAVMLGFRWISRMAYSTLWANNPLYSLPKVSSSNLGFGSVRFEGLEFGLLLLTGSIVLWQVGVARIVYFFAAGVLFIEHLMLSEEGGATSVFVPMAADVLVSVGGYAFKCAAVIAMPVAITILFFELAYLVFNRYLTRVDWVSSIRLPVVILVISLSLLTMSSQIAALFDYSVGLPGLKMFGERTMAASKLLPQREE